MDVIVDHGITHQLRIGEIWKRVESEDDDEAGDGQGGDGRDHGCRIGGQDPAVTDSAKTSGGRTGKKKKKIIRFSPTSTFLGLSGHMHTHTHRHEAKEEGRPAQ